MVFINFSFLEVVIELFLSLHKLVFFGTLIKEITYRGPEFMVVNFKLSSPVCYSRINFKAIFVDCWKIMFYE
jgi:hypothetical protein